MFNRLYKGAFLQYMKYDVNKDGILKYELVNLGMSNVINFTVKSYKSQNLIIYLKSNFILRKAAVLHLIHINLGEKKVKRESYYIIQKTFII